MLINGIDLSSLGVQLYNRVLTSNDIETTQDWIEGDIQPTFIRQQDKFKNIKLQFLITEQNEENAFLVMSRLAMLLKKATLVFDDIDLLFDTVMVGKTSQDRLKNGNFILTVNLQSDYAKGQHEIYTTDATATDFFYLNVVYYQDNKTLLGTDKVLIKASQFEGNDTFESLGINLNAYQPNYFNNGIVTNFIGKEINYENLQKTQTLIINYTPVVFSKEIDYYLGNEGVYSFITTELVSFTKAQVDNATTIGQIVDLSANKPMGYRAKTNFEGAFTFDNFMNMPRVDVYYDKIENELTKEVTVNYFAENDDGHFTLKNMKVVIVKESDVYDGVNLGDIVSVDAFKPTKYYDTGIIVGKDPSAAITFEDLELQYEVHYGRTENLVLVDYYLGTFPDWSRITTATYKIKYKTIFETTDNIIQAAGIDLNKYHTDTYENGTLRNGESITDFDSLLNIGVLQVSYKPKDYQITVSYVQEDKPLGYKNININDYMFIGNPTLGQIVDINAMRPEGYIFEPALSYSGEVSLSAMTAASPIIIAYVPVEQVRTKSIVIKYKQELASAFSVINTSVITIEESSIGGGTTLGDLINLNANKPEYYDNGIVDGYSASAPVTFDELQGAYDVLYMASQYQTQVRYYTDEIANGNWIGSSTLNYRIIDFTTSTTLVDLGLDINAFKPSYCDDGVVDYQGSVTFAALINLDAINIVYTSIEEPIDPGVDYPHRILFLQHNDMGSYESQFPNWTLNHAYINTGVTVPDMSKLTVLCDTFRVFDTEPLYNVNVNDAYLFGSMTPNGSYYIKYVNNTKFKPEELLTGTNTFNVCAGRGTPELIVTESASEGFSSNTGISASTRPGYSYATLTYTNLVQSNSAPVNVPLYLFACNSNGFYRGGIAGVGIKSCKIYYDNVLIRDYVPMTFYDKVGDKVAPSNCLFDKISQTFFEDARGLNSFNIMDDPDYTDENPAHKVSCCYVNYYKDSTLFQQSTVWFRGDEFVGDVPFDPYEKFFVDFYQPQFYGSGEITNLAEVGPVTFDNFKNKIFNVVYKATGHKIVVNYYKDTKDPQNLLATDNIEITEKDFYQVPTFGDIVPIQKYKPSGYKATYTYPEEKVTLRRLLEHSPYDIIYVKVDNPKLYTTKVSYFRKGFGMDVLHPFDAYVKLGEEILTLDETQFADGVYPESFMDLDKYYPESPVKEKPFYAAGAPYEWYLHDENLTDPSKLKTEYKISYEPVDVFIDVKYFTDVAEEANEIASTTWKIRIDDWEDGSQFYLVDELPNHYIDKFKPVICDGGHFENPSKLWTFEELAATGQINIIYDTLEEPHDPESTMFPSKIIWYDVRPQSWATSCPLGTATSPDAKPPKNADTWGAFIPYLDLGYTPKEIGRLRIETKAYSLIDGMCAPVSSFGAWTDDFAWFLGYYGGITAERLDEIIGSEKDAYKILLGNSVNRNHSTYSNHSAGWIGFKGHQPAGAGFVWSATHAQYIDGHSGWNNNTGAFNDNFDKESVKEIYGGFRRGLSAVDTPVGELVKIHSDYVARQYERDEDDRGVMLPPNTHLKDWTTGRRGFIPAVGFNPTTMTIDAYNDYAEYYDYKNSMNPVIFNIENKDNDLFATREKPKTSLTAFLTSNPTTGKINQVAFDTQTYLSMGMGLQWGGGQLGHVALENPWSENFTGSVTIEQQVITGTMDDGTPIYETIKTTKNIAYAATTISAVPVPIRTVFWSIKIWDRNRKVRDLIPVAKGDNIYSFTAPENGMFDLVTETFYTNQNKGGHYAAPMYHGGKFIGYKTLDVEPGDVLPLRVQEDPTIWGKVVVNYYDDDNNFLGNQYVEVPVTYSNGNISAAALLHYNDFKPNEFYHDGMVDIDADWAKKESLSNLDLKAIFDTGAINVYYKLITFTKTVVYYHGNSRVGSKDLFYSIKDLDAAESLADLGIDVNLYASEDYAPGRIVFNESVIANDDIQTFIDASSPIVVYDQLTKEQAPNLFYVDYYRAGAYDDKLITLDETDPNYLNCQLDATVLNPEGCIKYVNHYHSALYEDEKQDYFIAYQVDVVPNLLAVKKGPHIHYATLAEITDHGRYTVIEEKDGWGRLKEYRNGWIMLSHTKPVAGPGQNPDYEDPNLANVTIPFGTKISISRLTIDRLWAYCPAEASWIKTEEISCDQDGKLYRALHSDVIHLDTLDWSKIHSFEDMGIMPQAWKLKFHEDCTFEMPTEFTQAAFSNKHSCEFVYPETVYAYNCIYYKDLVQSENELGRTSFSISISDWNPDWDTFIETSYQKELVNEFPLAANKNDRNIPIMKEPNDTSLHIADILIGYTVTIHGKAVVTEGVEWYPVVYNKLGVIYEGYTKKDLLTIIPTTPWYRDINPTLYRDTPLTLTWDYFGMERNKYKPSIGNYDDGMYLWNPRTYNNEDVYFTFEELVTTGVQQVLYVHSLQSFKMVGDIGNSPIVDFCAAPDTEGTLPGSVDIETKKGYIPQELIGNYPTVSPYLNDSEATLSLAYASTHIGSGYGWRPDLMSTTAATSLPDKKYYDYIITNISNKRNNTIVYSYGRDTTGFKTPYYALHESGGYGKPTQPLPDLEITRATNLTLDEFDYLRPYKWVLGQRKYYQQWIDIKMEDTSRGDDSFYWIDFRGNQLSSNPEYTSLGHYKHLEHKHIYTKDQFEKGWVRVPIAGSLATPFFYRKEWNNYRLTHYYVPVARGQWLADGRQIPYNTVYDIISNQYIEYSGEKDIQIYNAGAVISDQNIHNPFESWYFETTDCNNTVKVKVKTPVYQYPDVLSAQISTYEIDTIVPIRKSTNDVVNHIQGLWYSDGNGWIKAENTETLPSGSIVISDFTPALQLAIKGDTPNKTGTYKAYLAPDMLKVSANNTFKSEQIAEFRFRSGDAYWNTESGWVPVVYTENGYNEIHKKYVVSAEYLFGYTHPLMNDIYKVAQYSAGDRFVVTKQLVKDPEWHFVENFGWVRINDKNTQELVE